MQAYGQAKRSKMVKNTDETTRTIYYAIKARERRLNNVYRYR